MTSIIMYHQRSTVCGTQQIKEGDNSRMLPLTASTAYRKCVPCIEEGNKCTLEPTGINSNSTEPIPSNGGHYKVGFELQSYNSFQELAEPRKNRSQWKNETRVTKSTRVCRAVAKGPGTKEECQV